MELIPLTIAAICIFIGILGTFLPMLPGTLFIWLAVFIHKLWLQDASVSWDYFYFITALTILAQTFDYALTYWGARKFGATWAGALGAVLGLIFMPFILTPFLGFLIGPVLGAIIGELIVGKNVRGASKASVGTLVGGLLAFILKVAVGVYIIVSFCYKVL